MRSKIRSVLFACIGLLFGMSVMYIYNNFIAEKKAPTKTENVSNASKSQSDKQAIDELTKEKTVINYVKQNHQLPDYYITKNEAKKSGWNPSEGNLCEVLPGKAIGGDYFGNREGKLPKKVKYYEADVNYNCGNRNGDRIVFTKNGEVYLTKNHYKSFEKQ
ncbi:ribonuclease domain-containing protein [Chryseobacterium chendengshani]|uniref:ribonuclease domain-containing protein n=1 Tax=Chryseobacterium sp. LJ756 TaxID=2864113 RepID=UPI001C642B84|nr:ribonuclease domain-containing protein [Chryseobacterium sp. LJ756]MBW7676715.1 ribonuclease N [Chryseobacterium sp. LJ756]